MPSRRLMPTLFLLLVLLLPVPAAPAAPAAPNSAGIVVQYPDGRVDTRTVSFEEPSISGLEALQRAGLTLETSGGLLCSINGSGCPGSDCFCGCPAPFDPCYYWSYFHWDGRGWAFSAVGTADYQLHDGDVDGYRWSESVAPGAHAYTQYAVEAAVRWLHTQQQANGSFPGFGVGATVDALVALAAANEDPATWRVNGGPSALDYLAAQAAAYATSAAATAKLLLAVVGANADPFDFGGLNLRTRLETFRDGSGRYGSSNWDQAYALLALRALHQEVSSADRAVLLSAETAAGGWGFMPTDAPDVDSTGLVLQALLAAGEPSSGAAVMRALAFLHSQQNADGGFPYQAPSATSVASTALAIQGLISASENPLSAGWTIGNTTPLQAVLALQSPRGGFAGFSGPDDLFATTAALPALLGKVQPLPGTAVAAAGALAWLRTQQAHDGSFGGTGQSVDAVFAVVTGGEDPAGWSLGGPTLIDYLATQAMTYTQTSAAAAGKLTLAVLAAQPQRPPTNFGGVNVAGRLLDWYNPAGGQFGFGLIDQAWGLLGYAAQYGPARRRAAAWLRQQQSPDGGWEFAAGFGSDTNTTALALQALAAAGDAPDSPAVRSALAYLRSQQNADGGFPYQKPCGYPGCDASDTNSTAYVIQGLTAVDEDADGWAWSRHLTGTAQITLTVHTALDALLALQSDEGGFAGYSSANDLYATLQAVPGVVRAAQPLAYRATLYYPQVRK